MQVNVIQGTLNSPRRQRYVMWGSAAILAAGIIAFVAVYFGNTAKPAERAATGQVIHAPKPAKNIPFPPAAWSVARQFMMTAVSRKSLAASYAITDPELRGGLTLRQWKTGTITVPFFPVAKILRTNWKNTNYAHPRDAQINVILIPVAGSDQTKPMMAQIGLLKHGQGVKAHWFVSYFEPISGPPVPSD
jgi:hypothetical protein